MVTLGSSSTSDNAVYVANWIKGVKLHFSRPFQLWRITAYMSAGGAVNHDWAVYDRNYNYVTLLANETLPAGAATWRAVKVNHVFPVGDWWIVNLNQNAITYYYTHGVADFMLNVSDGDFVFEDPLVAPTLGDHTFAWLFNGQWLSNDGRLPRTGENLLV